MVKGRIIKMYQSHYRDETFIHWVLRTKHNKEVYVTPCHDRPYFYLPLTIFFQLKSKIAKKLKYEPDYVIDKGVEFNLPEFADMQPVRVYTRYSREVGKIRSEWKNTNLDKFFHEADELFMNRIKIDNEIYGAVELQEKNGVWDYNPCNVDDVPSLKYCHIDFEMDDSKGYDNMERVLSVAYAHENENHSVINKSICYDDEERLAKELYEYIKQFDVICAFNGDEADFIWIKQLFKRHKIYVDWRHYLLIDTMRLQIYHNRRFTTKFVSLEDIAELYFGEGKVKLDNSFKWYFDNDRKTLLYYNERDALLDYKQIKMFNWLQVSGKICDICGTFLDEIFSKNKLIRPLYKRASLGKYVWRSSPNDVEVNSRESYKGAVVIDPFPGLHEKVFAEDFASLYNRIVQSEYLDSCVYNEKEDKFNLNREAIAPMLMEKLEAERNRYKTLLEQKDVSPKEYEIYDAMQYAVKFILLSVYGVFGQTTSSLYHAPTAARITRQGRYYILLVRDHINKFSMTIRDKTVTFRVIYGDTDSIFILIQSDIELTKRDMMICAKSVVRESNAIVEKTMLNMGIPKERIKMEMEFQEIDKKFFITRAKKHYVKLKAHDGKQWLDPPEMEIKGFKAIKSNTTPFVRNLQKAIFDRLLHDDDIENILSMLKQVRKDFMDGKYNEQLIISTGTRPLKEYAENNNCVQLRVALLMKEDGKYLDGQTVSYVITDYDKGQVVKPVYHPSEIPEITPKGLATFWNGRVYNDLTKIFETVMDGNEFKRQVPSIECGEDGAFSKDTMRLDKFW